MSGDFTTCEICGAEAWRTAYEGPVRKVAIEPAAERYWQDYLEESGRADCIFMLLKPKSSP